MKRNFAGLLVGCGLLAGCSGPSLIDHHRSPFPTPTTAETTPGGGGTDAAAFVFDSGVLEIGDFDPYTLGDNIFDPCTEISPEEFAAAGFDNVEPMPEEYRGLARGLSVCEAQDQNRVPVAAFMNNNANRNYVTGEVPLIDPNASRIVPSAFTYGSRDGGSPDCYAQVDTRRGALVVLVAGFPGYDTTLQTCDRAVSALESIYKLGVAS